jgi:transglutaminase-like putative cysteine protease
MTPTGLLGAALLLWGVSIELPWLGAALGVALEAARFATPARPLSPRIAAAGTRVTVLSALAALGYAAIARNFPHAIYDWLRWLPVLALPLPAMQRLAGGALPFGARHVETTHAYAAVALIAAGTGTGAGPWLYPAYAAIAAWAVAARAPRVRMGITLALAVVAAAIGHGVHVGVAAFQGQVEEWSTELLQELFDPRTDVYRERTRIGELGRIRLSDRIVMRVATPAPRPDAILLREVAFERYRNGEWHGSRGKPTPATREGDRWVLAPGEASHRLTLRRTVSSPDGLLALPAQARSVERLPADSLERMPTGAVRAHGLPRFVELEATYGSEAADAPPGDADLEVPEVILPAIDRVIEDEKLRKADAGATVAAVRAFFDANFAYSLELSGRGPAAPPRTLSDFLLVDRKGHCEYFATATALVLRRLGIASRYVAGYSAQEWSPLEGAFLVRGRHAHAWTTAFVDGRWAEVDTTPARWAQVEEREMHGPVGALLDRISWLVDRLVRWWFGEERDISDLRGPAIGIAAAALALALGIALRRRKKAIKAAPPDELARAWLALEASLARRGHARHPGETPREWAARLRRERAGEAWAEELVGLARAYYAARFDPAARGSAGEFMAAATRWVAPS